MHVVALQLAYSKFKVTKHTIKSKLVVKFLGWSIHTTEIAQHTICYNYWTLT